MAPQGVNRYALFAEAEEKESPPRKEQAPKDNPFVNQVLDTDAPWEEVKRGGHRKTHSQNQNQNQNQSRKTKTLIIRSENKTPLVHTRSKQTRDVSGSTQTSTEKFEDPRENYCGVCYFKFASKTLLLTHIKNTPNHSNYCNLCRRIFKDRNGLRNHVDSSQGHDIFCNLCLSAFKDHWGLKNHFENNYAVGHEFVCLTCLLGFHSKTALDKHLQSGEKHVWCNTCHRRFRNQDERDAHWSSTTKHKHCLQPGCDFDAPDTAILEKHLDKDHPRCEGCRRIFPSQTKLTQHNEACKFEIPCPECGQCYAGQVKLAAHMEMCIPSDDSGGYIDYNIKQHADTNTHATEHNKPGITTSHSINVASVSSCWTCTRSFPTDAHLFTHLESGTCPSFSDTTLLISYLGKWWYSALYMDLDVHAQIRRNEINLREMVSWMNQGVLQPFVCRANRCQKTFATFSALVAHVEGRECEWIVKQLRLDWLKRDCAWLDGRKDSVAS